ncbi:MAG: hypothetical protein ABR569_08240 [Gaiellaceae bacterium]
MSPQELHERRVLRDPEGLARETDARTVELPEQALQLPLHLLGSLAGDRPPLAADDAAGRMGALDQ